MIVNFLQVLIVSTQGCYILSGEPGKVREKWGLGIVKKKSGKSSIKLRTGTSYRNTEPMFVLGYV